jgi:hypothetical protein
VRGRDLNDAHAQLDDRVGGRLDPEHELGERLGEWLGGRQEEGAPGEVSLLPDEVGHLLEDHREDTLRHDARVHDGATGS